MKQQCECRRLVSATSVIPASSPPPPRHEQIRLGEQSVLAAKAAREREKLVEWWLRRMPR